MQEESYLNLVRNILDKGRERVDRTGVGTLSIFGEQLKFDISKHVPILTTKMVPWKSCIKELLWFMKGDTNVKILQQQGVNIWNGNTTRSFLDARGLHDLPENDMGAGYGFQWRHFGASYVNCHTDYTGCGIDQLMTVLTQLKEDPYSRRIFMSAWNPQMLFRMALPPCHVSCQFYVEENPVDGRKKLSCHMYQRSVDVFLGLPFNMLSYTVLTYILAHMTDMDPDQLIISTGDTHIYKNHIPQVKEMLSHTPLPPATLQVSNDVKKKTFEQLDISDFEIVNYMNYGLIRASMAV